MPSQTVENYIKTIYQLSERDGAVISTSALSEQLKTTSASVTDMLRKLAEMSLIEYKKYHGVNLTFAGKTLATEILRKHRLWETFLHEKLNIGWDGIHEIAEQLEHVNSPVMIEQLDAFLGHPKFDPHGDPIPDAQGRFTLRNQVLLHTLNPGDQGVIVAVKIHETDFLQYLDSIGFNIQTTIQVKEKMNYDGSLKISARGGLETLIGIKTAQNIYVKRLN